MKNDNDLDNNDESTPTKSKKPQQPPDKATPVNTKKDKRKTVPDNDDDGDEYEPRKVWRGGDFSFPPNWTLFEKMSKENAEYQKGVPFASCGKCNYYQAGHCKVVRGYIAPEMVCKYFSEKYFVGKK